MAISDDFDQADLEELARIEGKTVDELKRELLRERLVRGKGASAPAQTAPLMRVGTGDASGASLARARTDAVQRHQAQSFPGSPVVRYDHDPYGETAAQAEDRWLEEEATLLDGVHGLGGQSAGGIFGNAPIATSVYDPEAMGRADARVAQTATIQALGLVAELTQRLAELAPARPAGALPGAPTRRLGRGNRNG